VVDALEETNESVISHRVNASVRVLTAFSVVLLPLTLIASIFGMNVRVPGQGSIHAFWIIVGAMVAMLLGLLVYFKRRGWL
jgi:magnesium transporter